MGFSTLVHLANPLRTHCTEASLRLVQHISSWPMSSTSEIRQSYYHQSIQPVWKRTLEAAAMQKLPEWGSTRFWWKPACLITNMKINESHLPNWSWKWPQPPLWKVIQNLPTDWMRLTHSNHQSLRLFGHGTSSQKDRKVSNNLLPTTKPFSHTWDKDSHIAEHPHSPGAACHSSQTAAGPTSRWMEPFAAGYTNLRLLNSTIAAMDFKRHCGCRSFAISSWFRLVLDVHGWYGCLDIMFASWIEKTPWAALLSATRPVKMQNWSKHSSRKSSSTWEVSVIHQPPMLRWRFPRNYLRFAP